MKTPACGALELPEQIPKQKGARAPRDVCSGQLRNDIDQDAAKTSSKLVAGCIVGFSQHLVAFRIIFHVQNDDAATLAR